MSYEKDVGFDFEEYVAALFKEPDYTIFKKPEHYDKAMNTGVPDIGIAHNESGKRFWIECKYRDQPDYPNWCQPHDLMRYREFYQSLTDAEYFVALGLRRNPKNPEKLIFGHFSEFWYKDPFSWKYNKMTVRPSQLPEIVLERLR